MMISGAAEVKKRGVLTLIFGRDCNQLVVGDLVLKHAKTRPRFRWKVRVVDVANDVANVDWADMSTVSRTISIVSQNEQATLRYRNGDLFRIRFAERFITE